MNETPNVDQPEQQASSMPANGGLADPFGPEETKKKAESHYNTQYLVTNLKQNELRTKLIWLGVALAVVIGIIILVTTVDFSSSKPHVKIPETTEAAP